MPYVSDTPPPTTLTPYNISPKPLKPFSTSSINVCLPKYPPQFSLLAAIHLFISSHDEIKDFCSMDKKTGRRYVRRVRLATIIIVHERIVPPSLTFVVITTYSQRGIHKIYSKNTKYKYFLWLWVYQLYKHIYASVAGRHTLWRKEQRCPPAIYAECVRYTHTNNGAFIKYLLKSLTISSPTNLRGIFDEKRLDEIF